MDRRRREEHSIEQNTTQNQANGAARHDADPGDRDGAAHGGAWCRSAWITGWCSAARPNCWRRRTRRRGRPRWGSTRARSQAQTDAIAVAASNTCNGSAVVLTAADVTVGTWNTSTHTFTAGSSGANAVKVSAQRSAARGYGALIELRHVRRKAEHRPPRDGDRDDERGRLRGLWG